MQFKKNPGGNTKGNLVGHSAAVSSTPKRKTVAAPSVHTKGNTPVVGKAEKATRAAVKKIFK